MRAKRTSTPPSPRPQKALQKSSERLERSGEVALAYFDKDVVDAWRRAVIECSMDVDTVDRGKMTRRNDGKLAQRERISTVRAVPLTHSHLSNKRSTLKPHLLKNML